jgi:hypothetical protein
MVKISRIIHQAEWIRSTRIGELKIANVAPSKEHSLCNMISGHNRGRGLEQGCSSNPLTMPKGSVWRFMQCQEKSIY